MGVLIDFFRFLWKVLSGVLSFLVTLPGMVASCFVAVVSGITALVSNIYNSGTLIVRLLTSASEAVTSMMEYLATLDYYGIFHHMFALDVLGQSFSAFVTLALFFAGLCVFDFFFQGLVIAIPFLIYKTIGKLLQAVSAGFVKPA